MYSLLNVGFVVTSPRFMLGRKWVVSDEMSPCPTQKKKISGLGMKDQVFFLVKQGSVSYEVGT